MKVTKSNEKLLYRLSATVKNHRFVIIILAIIIKCFIESTSNSNVFGFSVEAKFWENRTNLQEARNLFSKYDDADFNEADYIESYDTWLKYGANYCSFNFRLFLKQF